MQIWYKFTLFLTDYHSVLMKPQNATTFYPSSALATLTLKSK